MTNESQHKFSTPLAELLRACTAEERKQLAIRSGTSVNYLYLLAGCHRERLSASLALAIEDASKELNELTFGTTPIVTARELATMCALSGFEELSDDQGE